MNVDEAVQYPRQFLDTKKITREEIRDKWPKMTELAISVILNDLERQFKAKQLAQQR